MENHHVDYILLVNHYVYIIWYITYISPITSQMVTLEKKRPNRIFPAKDLCSSQQEDIKAGEGCHEALHRIFMI